MLRGIQRWVRTRSRNLNSNNGVGSIANSHGKSGVLEMSHTFLPTLQWWTIHILLPEFDSNPP